MQNITLRKKIKFSIKDFLSKCNQIHRKLLNWSHLLKKSLTEISIFVKGSIECSISSVLIEFEGSWILNIVFLSVKRTVGPEEIINFLAFFVLRQRSFMSVTHSVRSF